MPSRPSLSTEPPAPDQSAPFVATLGWQEKLFAKRLNRFELLKLKSEQAPKAFTLRIHRNHGVEQVASALPAFLSFCGYAGNIAIGEYDDSVTLPLGDADVELLWLDFGRYAQLNDEELCCWLSGRLATFRETLKGAIVVANAPGEDNPRSKAINEVVEKWAAAAQSASVLDLARIVSALGSDAFDLRRHTLTGTKLSDAACLAAARQLGLQSIPQFFVARSQSHSRRSRQHHLSRRSGRGWRQRRHSQRGAQGFAGEAGRPRCSGPDAGHRV